MTAKKGIMSIYQGLAPGLAKYSLNQGSRFLVFDTIMGIINENQSIPTHLKRGIAGGIAGGISVIIN